MSVDPAPSSGLRARIRLSRNEIAHLRQGGIPSLKVGATGVEADLELRCSEVESDRARASSSNA
jgi:hypothetical protein